MSILDQLVLVPPALRTLSPAPAERQSVSVVLPSGGPAGPVRRVAPWFISRVSTATSPRWWQQLCARLQELQVVIECPAAELPSISAVAAPPRLHRQPAGRPLELCHWQSADLAELTCRSPESSAWGWPPEWLDGQRLPDLISALRIATAGKTAIGVGLPVGVDAAAVKCVTAAGIDFLSLQACPEVADEVIVETLVRLRGEPDAPDARRLPILLRTGHRRPDQLIKWLALGASLVTVDEYLEGQWPKPPPAGSSFLSSIDPADTADPNPLVQRLWSLQSALQAAVDREAPAPWTALKDLLRATTPTAARLAGVPLLGQ